MLLSGLVNDDKLIIEINGNSLNFFSGAILIGDLWQNLRVRMVAILLYHSYSEDKIADWFPLAIDFDCTDKLKNYILSIHEFELDLGHFFDEWQNVKILRVTWKLTPRFYLRWL